MIINLDPSFQPYPDAATIAFEAFQFSGGEPHLKIKTVIPAGQSVLVTHRVRSFNDMGLLLLAVDALRRMGVRQIRVLLPYFPGARQDRVMVPGEPLTVRVYADLINSLDLEEVIIFDPHSEVTPALLNRCTVISNHHFIKTVLEQLPGEVTLVAPDGGALKKIYKLSEALGGLPVVACSKNRDVHTGHLSGFTVHADNLQNRDCLVVDDICDGGGTFIGLAQALRERGAGKLYLAVSHGIFSKGIDELATLYSMIFTTDSFPGACTVLRVPCIDPDGELSSL